MFFHIGLQDRKCEIIEKKLQIKTFQWPKSYDKEGVLLVTISHSL